MFVETYKRFLYEDVVIDSQRVLDYAFDKLSSHYSSSEINKKVKKILNKAENEKDALKRIDKIKEKKDEKETSESFKLNVKSYLGG